MLPYTQNQIGLLQMEGIVLFAYGDESMDETCQRVCAVAGIIGSEEAWSHLESCWVAANDGVPFHAKDCETDQGNYAPKANENCDQKHKANQDLYKVLTILLCDSGLVGFAATANLIAERQHYPNVPALYFREFSVVIEALCWWARGRGELVKMCFDGRTQSDHNAGLIYGQMREQFPEWRPYLSEKIEFDYSRTNVRKQTADLFAREAMKHLDNRIGPEKRKPRKSWLALSSTGSFSFMEFGEEFFAQEEQGWNNALSLDGERFRQYLAWLDQRRRQHNLSNVISFVHSNPHPLIE